MRIQHIVPLPDISHTLRKQFLAGYYHSGAFESFHYLFSSSDILRSLTTGFHFASVLNSDLSSDPQVTDMELYPDTPTKLDISG